MKRRHLLLAGGIVVGLGAIALLLRGCYHLIVNTDDQPAADQIVAALQAYHAAGHDYPPTLEVLVPKYLPALPTPREFGRIGYAPLDSGRDCVLGYFTHREVLAEYTCATREWQSQEYEASRLTHEKKVQWLSGPRP